MSLLALLPAARWLLFAAALALFVARKCRRYARLRAFAGPFGTGWSNLWHTRVMLQKRSHLAYKAVNDKYVLGKGECWPRVGH